jgi:hypothetical protein
MELKSKTRKLTTIDSDDFDRFVESKYGGSFEFVAIHEANNYSKYEFSAPNMNMDFNGAVEAKIRQGIYPTYCLHTLFNVLLKDGHIEAGDYLIEVCW